MELNVSDKVSIEAIKPFADKLIDNLEKVIVGKRQTLEKMSTRTIVENAKPTMLIHGHPSQTKAMKPLAQR